MEKTVHPGETGAAFWQTLQLPGLRIRLVEYTPGYLANHWCTKGHMVHCLEGEVESELVSGKTVTLKAGISYIVGDEMSRHRSKTENGVKLLIIDGDFLACPPANNSHL
jgi:quercetin dioxygenase-like cupin family protein